MSPNVDVLVCSHNEADYIGRALESLALQTVGSRAFRVIVVDNASVDNTAGVVQRYAGKLEALYVAEPRIGLNWARNTGYDNATADYVAHIDADARAHPRWMEALWHVIDSIGPDLCGGPYRPYYVSPKPAWYLDRYNSVDLGGAARDLDAHEYLNGTNMVWRRSLVKALGGFRPDVGVVGRNLARGDETELIVRARRNNHQFRAYYTPDAMVYHLTRPEAMTLTYWARRHFIYGRNWKAFFEPESQRSAHSAFRLARSCLRTARLLLKDAAHSVLASDRSQYPRYQNFVYERVLPELGLLGALSAAIFPIKRPGP